MKNRNLKSPAIFIQAVTAMLIIQLVHKIVREIPGAIGIGGFGAYANPAFAVLLIIAIVLLMLRKKIGVYLGLFDAAFMLFQPVLVHIIWAEPDQNGIWWYPIFPWTQAALIFYFSLVTLRNEKKND
jgi:hypothetical protein